MKFRCLFCGEEFENEYDAFMHVGYGHNCIAQVKENRSKISMKDKEKELREAGFGDLVDELKKEVDEK